LSEAEIAWTVHPARRSPVRASLAVGVAVLAATFAAAVGRSTTFAVFAALFVVLSVASFLFPTHYRLFPDGVEVRVLGARRRRKWSELSLARESKGEIWLTPTGRPGFFDSVRTILLRLPDEAEAIRRFVHERIA
jgi:hypothetical protein